MAAGDMWRKALDYFGFADDVDEYDDEYDDEPATRARSSASPASGGRGAAEELERNYRERPNVRRLGPRRDDYEDLFNDDAPPSRPSIRAVESRHSPAQVHLVIPKSFNDAQQIADKFKVGVPVILNMQSAENDLAKRLIDFSSGLTYAMDGGMQRVADKVFMLTPRNVEVSAEERARLLEKGFFNQY
ncbi:MAG: cell division protein SepF [Thermoleophilia bacterium]|nr:cell division protein SepF [Thermoleophilia bacterium]